MDRIQYFVAIVSSVHVVPRIQIIMLGFAVLRITDSYSLLSSRRNILREYCYRSVLVLLEESQLLLTFFQEVELNSLELLTDFFDCIDSDIQLCVGKSPWSNEEIEFSSVGSVGCSNFYRVKIGVSLLQPTTRVNALTNKLQLLKWGTCSSEGSLASAFESKFLDAMRMILAASISSVFEAMLMKEELSPSCARWSSRLHHCVTSSVSFISFHLAMVAMSSRTARNIIEAFPFLKNAVDFKHVSRELFLHWTGCHERISSCELELSTGTLFWNFGNIFDVVDIFSKLGASECDNVSTVSLFRFSKLLLQNLSLQQIYQYFPQLIQLLRVDVDGVIGSFMSEMSSQLTEFCHRNILALTSEMEFEVFNLSEKIKSKTMMKNNDSVGVLSKISVVVCNEIVDSLTLSASRYLANELQFFDEVSSICTQLVDITDRQQHVVVIKELAQQIKLGAGIYLPTSPNRQVLEIDFNSAMVMPSKGKIPFSLSFRTISWTGPDSFLSRKKISGTEITTPMKSQLKEVGTKKIRGIGKTKGFFVQPRAVKTIEAKSREAPKIKMDSFHSKLNDAQSVIADCCLFKHDVDCRQDSLAMQVCHGFPFRSEIKIVQKCCRWFEF